MSPCTDHAGLDYFGGAQDEPLREGTVVDYHGLSDRRVGRRGGPRFTVRKLGEYPDIAPVQNDPGSIQVSEKGGGVCRF